MLTEGKGINMNMAMTIDLFDQIIPAAVAMNNSMPVGWWHHFWKNTLKKANVLPIGRNLNARS